MYTPQLVGRDCVNCGQRIGAIDEGDFCSACGCPVHFSCWKRAEAPPPDGPCPGCGAAGEILAAKQREIEEELAEAERNRKATLAYKLIGSGLTTIVMGAGLSFACTVPMSLGGRFLLFTGPLVGGGLMVMVGMIRLLRV